MYYPYFRGKQYELVMIRENAELFRRAGFTPIIEPVKEALSGLKRTLAELAIIDAQAIVIVNPSIGDHSADGSSLQGLLDKEFRGAKSISTGILVTADSELGSIDAVCDRNAGRSIAIVHHGYAEGKSLAAHLAHRRDVSHHVFLDEWCGKLYRRHFTGPSRVLVRDGFQRRANREHPDVEPFSDLHVTFSEEGVNGFGDFLVAGNDYIEGGGAAYTVAIHLTFVDPDRDDEMFIRHFLSDRTDTPTDPAGKFAEAVEKLVAEVRRPDTHIEKTRAVIEFMDLHAKKHFPGLGYVKKLSMQHHVETMDRYFNKT